MTRAALPSADQSGRDAAYRRSISIHCPNQDEMTTAVRVDIAKMRDRAVIGRQRASEAAGDILLVVARVAVEAVYAGVPCSRLLRIRSALGLAIEAAVALERAMFSGK